MSIQGSFNSILSSLVSASAGVRQARAQEKIAGAKEQDARMKRATEEAQLSLINAQIRQTEQKTAQEQTAFESEQKQKKAQLRQTNAITKRIKGLGDDALTGYLNRGAEIEETRQAVSNIVKSMKGGTEDVRADDDRR